MNQLRHMAVFAHIVESGSITGAAETLDLSKSVVSQHLKALEQSLGITLLKRTTRRQMLTAAGRDFYEHCKSLNQIADQAWQQAQQVLEVPKGNIRITAPNALMDTLVAPAIAELLIEYPLLEPELISSDAQLDLMADNIDLAIRVGPSSDSNIKQRRMGEFRDVLCGKAQLLRSTALEDIPYIANSWQGKQIEHEFRPVEITGKEVQTYSTQARCISNSFHTCVSLIEAGTGIGLIPDFRLAKPQHSTLVKVFPNRQLPLNPVYALHTFNKQMPLNVQVCLDAIGKRFTR